MKKLIFGITITAFLAFAAYTTYSQLDYRDLSPHNSPTGWVSSAGVNSLPGYATNIRYITGPGGSWGFGFRCVQFGLCYNIIGNDLWIYGIDYQGDDENDPNSIPGSGYQNPPVEVEIMTGP